MVKSHKIYNLIFDFLLAAGVCFYNDLRFMRVWFLGGQLYHSVGFTNYRFGLTGKEVCWDFSPLNILHCLQGYDSHAYLKFLCFFLHRYFDVFPVCVPGTKTSSAVVCAAVLFQRRVYCSR